MPLTATHVTATGPCIDGAAQLHPATVSDVTVTWSGTLMVAVASALCEPPWLVTTNGTIPTLPFCSGSRSVASMPRSASWVVAHTGLGSTATRPWADTATELQATWSAEPPTSAAS